MLDCLNQEYLKTAIINDADYFIKKRVEDKSSNVKPNFFTFRSKCVRYAAQHLTCAAVSPIFIIFDAFSTKNVGNKLTFVAKILTLSALAPIFHVAAAFRACLGVISPQIYLDIKTCK